MRSFHGETIWICRLRHAWPGQRGRLDRLRTDRVSANQLGYTARPSRSQATHTTTATTTPRASSMRYSLPKYDKTGGVVSGFHRSNRLHDAANIRVMEVQSSTLRAHR